MHDKPYNMKDASQREVVKETALSFDPQHRRLAGFASGEDCYLLCQPNNLEVLFLLSASFMTMSVMGFLRSN